MIYACGNINVTTKHYNSGNVARSERLKISIPLINNGQLQRLFDLATSLDDEPYETHVMSALALLTDYIMNHCRDEEALMIEFNYPNSVTEAHLRLHHEFRNMLSDLQGRASKMSHDDLANEIREIIKGLFDHLTATSWPIPNSRRDSHSVR